MLLVRAIEVIIFVLIPGYAFYENYPKRPVLSVCALIFGAFTLAVSYTDIHKLIVQKVVVVFDFDSTMGRYEDDLRTLRDEQATAKEEQRAVTDALSNIQREIRDLEEKEKRILEIKDEVDSSIQERENIRRRNAELEAKLLAEDERRAKEAAQRRRESERAAAMRERERAAPETGRATPREGSSSSRVVSDEERRPIVW